MAAQFEYTHIHKMQPRPGVKFATVYYKQTPEQRELLRQHLMQCISEIAHTLDVNPVEQTFATKPLKGFPKTGGQKNRSLKELLTDTIGECEGKTRQGQPKDFAQAPLERWNKLFAGTRYEVEMTQSGLKPRPQLNTKLFTVK